LKSGNWRGALPSTKLKPKHHKTYGEVGKYAKSILWPCVQEDTKEAPSRETPVTMVKTKSDGVAVLGKMGMDGEGHKMDDMV
jgi:hypothetical protein